MIEFNWFGLTCLMLAGCAAFARAYPAMDRVTLAIGLNWIVNTSFVLASGLHDPFWFFIATDFAAALLILRRPAALAQALLGGSYLTQIAIHVGYGAAWLSNPHAGASYEDMRLLYLNWLDWIAYAQLAVLVFWAGGHGRGRKIAAVLGLHRNRMESGPAHREGDGQ